MTSLQLCVLIRLPFEFQLIETVFMQTAPLIDPVFIPQLFTRVDTCTSDFFRIQALPLHSAEHYRMAACSVSARRIKDSHEFNDQDFLIRYRHWEDRHQDFLIRRDIGFGMGIEKSVIGRSPGFGLASRHRFAQREQE